MGDGYFVFLCLCCYFLLIEQGRWKGELRVSEGFSSGPGVSSCFYGVGEGRRRVAVEV